MTKDENTPLKDFMKIEALTPASNRSQRMTRLRLKELNESTEDKIVIKDFDVGEIMKLSRKIRKDARLKEKSLRENSKISKKQNTPELNSTYTLDRDFTTPEFDSPVMEAMRKGILEELNQSVTMRIPRKVLKNVSATPSHQSSSSSSLRPHRRLVNIKIHQNFDDLNTDDSFDSDEERGNRNNSDVFNLPHWTDLVKEAIEAQDYLDNDFVDVFFCSDQVFNIDPQDLFPQTDQKSLERRRSSMWEDSP